MVRLVRAEKMVLSGLVFARKIARFGQCLKENVFESFLNIDLEKA